jgi:hypothetical protein
MFFFSNRVEGGGGGLTVSGVSRNRGGFVKCVAIQKRLEIPVLGVHRKEKFFVSVSLSRISISNCILIQYQTEDCTKIQLTGKRKLVCITGFHTRLRISWPTEELFTFLGQCSATFFSSSARPNLLKNTWRHTTKFRLMKRGYETIHGHKYVSTYKHLPYKNAGIWKQNITHVE